MIKNYVMLLMLFFGVSNVGFTQEVTGKILDGETSQPLPGASVLIKGTTTGVVSNFDGDYTISANMGDILVFSYAGFEPQEIKVTTGIINVT